MLILITSQLHPQLTETNETTMLYTLILRPRDIVEAEELALQAAYEAENDAIQEAYEAEEMARYEREMAAYETHIRQEAERIRSMHIRTACDSGEVIVGNRYYDSSNPLWKQLAEEEADGLDLRPSADRYVETSYMRDYTSEYLDAMGQGNQVKKLKIPVDTSYILCAISPNPMPFFLFPQAVSMSSASSSTAYLRAQQRVNAAQDYSRFGGRSGIPTTRPVVKTPVVATVKKPPTAHYGNRGAQGSTLLSSSHPAMNPARTLKPSASMSRPKAPTAVAPKSIRCPGKKPCKR